MKKASCNQIVTCFFNISVIQYNQKEKKGDKKMYGYCFNDGYACVSKKSLSKSKIASLERQHGTLRSWGKI